jgi:hypothetical protein
MYYVSLFTTPQTTGGREINPKTILRKSTPWETMNIIHIKNMYSSESKF